MIKIQINDLNWLQEIVRDSTTTNPAVKNALENLNLLHLLAKNDT